MTGTPLIIGHRGASAVAPENTLAAFKQAIEAGADGVEFDVRLSRDGVPVVIHDETLERTAMTKKRVADLSVAELQELNAGSWFSRARRTTDLFSNERIPTLQQLFELFRLNRGLLYLEMKCDPLQRNELVAACCNLVMESLFCERVIVESFDLAAIEGVKRLSSSIRTAALFEPRLVDPQSLLMSKRLIDRATEVKADEIALHHTLATPRVIEKAKVSDLKIVVWTVDDPSWIQRARSLGVDALITNDPDRMLRQRNLASAV